MNGFQIDFFGAGDASLNTISILIQLPGTIQIDKFYPADYTTPILYSSCKTPVSIATEAPSTNPIIEHFADKDYELEIAFGFLAPQGSIVPPREVLLAGKEMFQVSIDNLVTATHQPTNCRIFERPYSISEWSLSSRFS
jgi:hypothetical protein